MAINILEHFMREDRYQFFEEETISTYRLNIRKKLPSPLARCANIIASELENFYPKDKLQ